MEKITIESLFNLKSISQPTQVDDQLFYIENSMDEEKNCYQSTIISYDLKTKEKNQWGNHGSSVDLLKVSPNKKYISFLASDDNKKQQIMLMPLTGGRAFYLTQEPNGVSSYLFNETGSSVYYQTSSIPETHSEDDLVKPKMWSKLSYKLDGVGLISEDKKYQLKKQDISLITTAQLVLEKANSFRLNHLSKDESFLLITEDLDKEDEMNYGSTVFYYDIKTGINYSLTTSVEKGSFSFGAIREDKSVLLVGNDFKHGFVTQDKMYLYELGTQQLTCLTADEDLQVGDALISDFQQKNLGVQIEWLDDENYLYPVTESGKVTLYKGNLEKNSKKVFDKRVHLTDGYLVDSFDTMIVTYSTLTRPSVLALLDLNTGELSDIEDPNQEFMANTQVSSPQMFWYKGVDDWDIQGWYVPPVQEKKHHPVILYVHGGPQVAYGESFFHEMQVHAANGYGVIMLNPRGGQGYGQDFVKAILGDYGNEDYQDLMLGLDYCLTEYPEISKKDVYLAGGSYGGFMTNWIVGHTNRFKAAVTQRSISNWISFYGTSDIGVFFVKYQLNADLADIEKLWQLSPLAYANQIETPLLVLHGEEDLRCPQEQGEQIYTAVKKNNIPSKMIVYPESSHGLSRQGLPHLRVDRMKQIINWFSQY